MQKTDVPLLNELDPIETASIDELRSLQYKRMKWTLDHAYANVSYYRAKCVAQGVHPDDLNHLDDINKFPFTTKEDLRKAYPFDSFAVPMEEVVRIHASSGTTGKPTVVGYTKQDLKVWAGVVARSLRAGGVNHSDRVHISYGYGLFTGGMGAHYGAEELGCTVIPMSGGQTEKQVQLMRDFDPDVIMVTPSYMLVLADEMERQGLDPREIKLRSGIFGAEPWTNKMRDEMESRLGIDWLMDCLKLLDRVLRWNVLKQKTAQPFGKIISTLKSLMIISIRSPMGKWANWSLHP